MGWLCDLAFSSNAWANALIGAEYRSPDGFLFTVSGGMAFNVGTYLPSLNLTTGIGYAF